MPGMEPLCHALFGHQFRGLCPAVGRRRNSPWRSTERTGREVGPASERSGLTPFVERGDGRAVLRSTIREYLCSEAMHGLGIPTDSGRSVVVGSDHQVYREQVGNRRDARADGAVSHALRHRSRSSLPLSSTSSSKSSPTSVIANHFPNLRGWPRTSTRDSSPRSSSAHARADCAMAGRRLGPWGHEHWTTCRSTASPSTTVRSGS